MSPRGYHVFVTPQKYIFKQQVMQIFKNFFVFIFNNLQKGLKLLSFQRVRFSHKITQIVKKNTVNTHKKISKKTVQKHDFSIYSKSMVYKKRKFAIYLKIYKVKISITKKQNPKGVQVWRYVRAYRRAYIPRRAPLPMYTV